MVGSSSSHSVAGERFEADADYEGIRIRSTGSLENARIPMQLDIGFGEAVSSAMSEHLTACQTASTFVCVRKDVTAPNSYGAVPQTYLNVEVQRGTVAKSANVFERAVKCSESGGPCRDRTCDHLIKRQVLTLYHYVSLAFSTFQRRFFRYSENRVERATYAT